MAQTVSRAAKLRPVSQKSCPELQRCSEQEFPSSLNWGLPSLKISQQSVSARQRRAFLLTVALVCCCVSPAALSGSVVGQTGKDLDTAPARCRREMPLGTSYL